MLVRYEVLCRLVQSQPFSQFSPLQARAGRPTHCRVDLVYKIELVNLETFSFDIYRYMVGWGSLRADLNHSRTYWVRYKLLS